MTELMQLCSLKDLLIRTETNKLVTDLVNLDLVRSLLRMLTMRRRHTEERDKRRLGMLSSRYAIH